ncbi:MAG: glycosyltransferase [bacterium]
MSLKIALVAGGLVKIPPENWGAIENIIANYDQYLSKLGHCVTIFNTPWWGVTIDQLNNQHFDFIHCHFDILALPFNTHLKKSFCITSHYGGWMDYVNKENDPTFKYILQDTFNSPANIALAPEIANFYKDKGYKGFLKTLRNAVEVDQFEFSPQGNNMAICLGRIQTRKRQHYLAKNLENKVRIDFIGPFEERFKFELDDHQTTKYIGNWSKQTVRNSLTKYSSLVLLSESEAAPLVVLEALAAGLSLVVSQEAAANLPVKDFITILNSEQIMQPQILAEAIQKSIDQNHLYRHDIRDLAKEYFDYNVVTLEYLQIIEEFRDYSKNSGKLSS